MNHNTSQEETKKPFVDYRKNAPMQIGAHENRGTGVKSKVLELSCMAHGR